MFVAQIKGEKTILPSAGPSCVPVCSPAHSAVARRRPLARLHGRGSPLLACAAAAHRPGTRNTCHRPLLLLADAGHGLRRPRRRRRDGADARELQLRDSSRESAELRRGAPPPGARELNRRLGSLHVESSAAASERRRGCAWGASPPGTFAGSAGDGCELDAEVLGGGWCWRWSRARRGGAGGRFGGGIVRFAGEQRFKLPPPPRGASLRVLAALPWRN